MTEKSHSREVNSESPSTCLRQLSPRFLQWQLLPQIFIFSQLIGKNQNLWEKWEEDNKGPYLRFVLSLKERRSWIHKDMQWLAIAYLLQFQIVLIVGQEMRAQPPICKTCSLLSLPKFLPWQLHTKNKQKENNSGWHSFEAVEIERGMKSSWKTKDQNFQSKSHLEHRHRGEANKPQKETNKQIKQNKIK